MSRYDNIPSIFIELLDGNLQVDKQITGPVVLVIGTALSGPTNTQYLVTDANKASAIYGSGSPLLKGLSQVRMGGAQNIILYRVGGKAAQLIDIFGADTSVETKDQTVNVGSQYRVYIGTEPNDPLKDCIIVFDLSGKIVYSNVTGQTVDLGKIIVTGFDKDAGYNFRIGTPSVPVLMSEALTAPNIREDMALSVAATLAQSTYPLGGTGAIIDSVTINAVPVLAADYSVVGSDLVLDGPVAATVAALDDVDIIYSLPTTIAGASFSAGENNINATLQKKYELLDAAYADLETTIATDVTIAIDGVILDAENIADGSVAADKLDYFMKTESLGEVEYEWSTDQIIYTGKSLTFTADGDGVEDTFTITDADAVGGFTIASVEVDGNPVAAGPGATQYTIVNDTIVFGASVIPTLDTDNIVVVFNNDKVTDVADAALDASGQPIVLSIFNEVNFAHQLGTWLYNITENERFVLGTIGTSKPTSTSTSGVAKWIGTLPQTDAFGVITANGSGLLGNKFMAGNTSRVNGFYLTDSGFVDGNIILDSNGAPVDLGKYLSVVAGALVTPDLKSVGSSLGIENGAMVYAGLISTVVPGNSTTNIDVLNVGLPFIIKKTKLNELSGAGYVTFYTKPEGQVGVVSGELPTGPDSDYDYISTTLIVSNIVTRIRARINPYLGKGLNSAMVAAMNTAVEQIFKDEVAAGSVIKYGFNIIVEPTSNGRGKVRIPVQLVPAFELREVNVPIKLAYDI